MNNIDTIYSFQFPIQQNNYLQTDSTFENISIFLNQSESLNYYNRLAKLKNDEEFFNSSNLTFEPWLTVLIAIVATLMSSTTIIGNVFVITAFIIDKNLRKYSNYFILNLSIADLLIGILIPPYAPFLLNRRHWRLGRLACTVWLVLDYVVGSASVLCIVVISLDRYLLVSRGLNYVASQKVFKAILIMITVWSIAFLNYAPAIIFWEIISGSQTVKEGECQVAFHDNLVYLTATACVEFFAPFISICGLNLAVYLNIRKRSRGLIRSENPQFKLDKNVQNNQKQEEKRKKSLTVQIQSQKSMEKNKKLKRPFSISASSTTCSTSSLDDIQPVLKKSAQKSSRSHSKSQIESTSLLNGLDKPKLSTSSNLTNQKRVSLVCQTIEANHNACTSIVAMQTSKPNATGSVITLPANNYNSYSKTKKPSTGNRTLTKDKKAARSLFILVFVFVFCWAPYTFLTLIKAVCPTCVNDHAYEFAFWLLWFNSTLNPILYPFLHVKFRKAFLKIIQHLLFCIKFKKKGYQPQPMTINMTNTNNFNVNNTTNGNAIFRRNEKVPSNV